MKNRLSLSLFLAQNNVLFSGLVVIIALLIAGAITLSQAAWGLAVGLIVFGLTYMVTRRE